MIPVIIQAGGEGTRLRPYTTILPKPLMPVGDMPILEIVIKQLKHYGLTDITITTGHLAHLIQAFFGDGSQWGVSIKYVRENEPLGTIGPIRLIDRPATPFIVMNGDILTDLNYLELVKYHQSHRQKLTVSVYEGKVPVSLGVVGFDADHCIVKFEEKPTLRFWSSMGIYVFSPECWDMIPARKYFGFDSLMAEILKNAAVAKVYPWHGEWLDIGRPEDYERASRVFEVERGRFLPETAV